MGFLPTTLTLILHEAHPHPPPPSFAYPYSDTGVEISLDRDTMTAVLYGPAEGREQADPFLQPSPWPTASRSDLVGPSCFLSDPTCLRPKMWFVLHTLTRLQKLRGRASDAVRAPCEWSGTPSRMNVAAAIVCTKRTPAFRAPFCWQGEVKPVFRAALQFLLFSHLPKPEEVRRGAGAMTLPLGVGG